jgi:hypothetical protein
MTMAEWNEMLPCLRCRSYWYFIGNNGFRQRDDDDLPAFFFFFLLWKRWVAVVGLLCSVEFLLGKNQSSSSKGKNVLQKALCIHFGLSNNVS